MSLYRHPDPRIEAWLADGPTTLSGIATMGIKTAARALPQRRGVALPWSSGGRSTRTMLLAAAAVLAAAATLALVVGGPVWFAPDPGPTATPAASPSAAASAAALASPPTIASAVDCFPLRDQPPGGMPVGGATLTGLRVAVEYSLPPEAGVTVAMAGGTLGFAAEGTHGIVVVDVTEARRHGSLIEQPRLGTDARTFLEDLEKRFPYTVGQVIDFDVTDLTATTLGGRTAWSAVVTWSAEHNSWTHIDRATYSPTVSACALEFDVPHRLFVVDVGKAVVAVQIWAATEPELTAWLPQAIGLADSLVLSEARR
jgi:hypothetical protein